MKRFAADGLDDDRIAIGFHHLRLMIRPRLEPVLHPPPQKRPDHAEADHLQRNQQQDDEGQKGTQGQEGAYIYDDKQDIE